LSLAPKHIGFLTTSYPRFLGDAPGAFVHGMARSLVQRGHRVTVLAPQPAPVSLAGAPVPASPNTPETMDGVRVVRVPYARPRRWQTLFYEDGVLDNLRRAPHRLWQMPAALAALGTSLARHANDWDGLISHWLLPSALLASVFAPARLPHLALAHSGDVHLLSRIPLGAPMARRISRHARHVGFVSAQLRAEYAAILGTPSAALPHHRVVPMGCFGDELRTDMPREAVRDALGIEGFAVLFLGRMVPIKGLDVLLRALAGLEGAMLVAAGDGEQRSAWEAMAKDTAVRALFTGSVDPRMRARLLHACDALVVPSLSMPDGRHEGMPLVVLEGLTAQIPVIASDTGGIGEVISHRENGWLTAPGDAAALRQALSFAMANPAVTQKWSHAGAASAAPRQWEVLAPQLLSMLFDR